MKAELIDMMGDDLRVVNAARVSFSKESEWELEEVVGHLGYNPFLEGYSQSLSEKDQKLIKYLATHGHWTPFSHVMVTMRETVPIFVARQRFKHMVGFTYNEVSRRYVDDAPEFFVPEYFRKAADNKKQGSSEEPVRRQKWAFEAMAFSNFVAEQTYKFLLLLGVAPEQARMVLPQSMYTSYYVTGSLAAWARAYKLRIDGHAQKEIQDLATQWHQIISSIPSMTHSWSALAS